MSYIINKTNGAVLTEIIDGTIDQVVTDLTLFGKSSSAYGEHLNENFVKLLENFAKSTSPAKPIEGQIWYDSVEKRLKVYDGKNFRLTAGTLVSDFIPSSIAQGDIWIDTRRHQLYFHDGESVVLAGPTPATTTGFTIITSIDTLGRGHDVMLLKIDSLLFAIFSTDEFIPQTSIEGFTGKVSKGFNFNFTSKITNLDDTTAATDAVNNRTLEKRIKQNAPYAISLNITDVPVNTVTNSKNENISTMYLSKIFPASSFAVAADPEDPLLLHVPKCRVVCTDDTTVTIREFHLEAGVWEFKFIV